MKSIAILLLKAAIVLIGLAALGLLLWEPHLEGRNDGAGWFQIYFQDPFLAGVYIASIAFFVGLYQGFRLLDFAGRGELASASGVRALGAIKLCALALVGFVILGEVVIFIQTPPSDDRAGGVAMGVLFGGASLVVASTAAVLQGALRRRTAAPG